MRRTSEQDAKLAQQLGQLEPFQLYSHRNAWANLHLLGQPNTSPLSRFYRLRLGSEGAADHDGDEAGGGAVELRRMLEGVKEGTYPPLRHKGAKEEL